MTFLAAASTADTAASHAQAALVNTTEFAERELATAIQYLAQAVAELARAQHRAK